MISIAEYPSSPRYFDPHWLKPLHVTLCPSQYDVKIGCLTPGLENGLDIVYTDRRRVCSGKRSFDRDLYGRPIGVRIAFWNMVFEYCSAVLFCGIRETCGGRNSARYGNDETIYGIHFYGSASASYAGGYLFDSMGIYRHLVCVAHW